MSAEILADTIPDPPDVDVLAIAAHRDDVEQTCGGTLLRMASRGLRTAILDLTQGEAGTRGSAEERAQEAAEAARQEGSIDYTTYAATGLRLMALPTLQLSLDGLADKIHAVFPLLQDGLDPLERPLLEPGLHILGPQPRATDNRHRFTDNRQLTPDHW